MTNFLSSQQKFMEPDFNRFTKNDFFIEVYLGSLHRLHAHVNCSHRF
jgi:hypothetical protein